MRQLIFIVTMTFLTINIYSQTNEKKDSLIELKIKCTGDSLSIKIPNGQYNTKKDSYEEGFIFSIIYFDGSYISFLCGSNAEFNLKMVDNLYSRKEKLRNRTVIYQNVNAERLNIFNEAFNLFNTY